MNTMTTGQLAAAIELTTSELATALLFGVYQPPITWLSLSNKQVQDRIRKAKQHGHLKSSKTIGIYSIFDTAAIQQWVNGGCRYASERVNEEAE